jgi:hypothetical protein
MDITNAQRQARADIIHAMEVVVHTQSKFDIHSVTHCMLCAYFKRSKDKHPEVERFTSEYVSRLFGITEAAAIRLFALEGPSAWDGSIGEQYEPRANLARLIITFEEYPL